MDPSQLVIDPLILEKMKEVDKKVESLKKCFYIGKITKKEKT